MPLAQAWIVIDILSDDVSWIATYFSLDFYVLQKKKNEDFSEFFDK